MWSVIRYHHLLRSGVSWKINKNIVALWHNSLSDTDSDKTSTLSLAIDDNDNCLDYSNSSVKSTSRSIQWLDFGTSDSEIDEEMKVDDEKILGEGSDEDNSLLVIVHEPRNIYWR